MFQIRAVTLVIFVETFVSKCGFSIDSKVTSTTTKLFPERSSQKMGVMGKNYF